MPCFSPLGRIGPERGFIEDGRRTLAAGVRSDRRSQRVIATRP